MSKILKLGIGILVLVVVILLSSTFLKGEEDMGLQNENETKTEVPTLSESEALNFIKGDLIGGECSKEGVYGSYVSCSIDVSKTNNGYMVQVTYMGLYDDSVVASRIEVNLVYSDGMWLRGQTVETHKCHEGRGHQDFSAEFCT